MTEAEADSAGDAGRVETDHSRRRPGRADHGDGAGGVPAAFVVGRVDPGADDELRLQTGDVGVEHGTAGPSFFTQRQQRRRRTAVA